MPKTPEEIIAEFEERFGHICAGSMHYACESEREIKSFLATSLVEYGRSVREETIDEALRLVEDEIDNGNSYPMTYEQGYNTANNLWRTRIEALKEKI